MVIAGFSIMGECQLPFMTKFLANLFDALGALPTSLFFEDASFNPANNSFGDTNLKLIKIQWSKKIMGLNL